MQLAIVLSLAVAIGAVAFALQNNVAVTVTFFLWRFDSTLAMVLLIAVALGALVMALLSTPAVLRLQWSGTRLRREINALESANRELRAQLTEIRTRAGADVPPAPDTDSNLASMAPRRP
ncbi:MAG: LapA family protein [Pseudomonadota bacterium]